MWDVGKAMHEAERDGIHYRTVDMEGCKFCAYKGLCSTDWKDGDVLPEEFEVIENENPELS